MDRNGEVCKRGVPLSCLVSTRFQKLLLTGGSVAAVRMLIGLVMAFFLD